MKSKQFFYQKGAHSNRNGANGNGDAGPMKEESSDEEYSSLEEVETERER